MATRYRFLGEVSDIDVTHCVEVHPRLRQLRATLQGRGVSPGRSQAMVERILIAALDDFSTTYLREIGGRVDRIVELRGQIRDVYEGVLGMAPSGRTSPERSTALFQELEEHMDAIDGMTAQRYLERRRPIEYERVVPSLEEAFHEAQAPTRARLESPPEPSARLEAAAGLQPGGLEPIIVHVGRQQDAARGMDILGRMRGGGVAPELESQLAALRGQVPDPVILGIVRGIGRTISPDLRRDATPLRNISRFLAGGGDPRVLERLLDWRDGLWNEFAATTALQKLGLLEAADYNLLETVMRHRAGVGASNTLIGLLRNMSSPAELRDIFGVVHAIEERSTRLGEVFVYLGSGGPNLNIAALGVLRVARSFLDEYPGSRVVFEAPLEGVPFRRIPDFRLELPFGHPLDHLQVELKEITRTDILLGHAQRQFAEDVLNALRIPPPPGGHLLSRLRWIIRTPDLDTDPPRTPLQIALFRDEIEMNLAAAVRHPLLADHPLVQEAIRDFWAYHEEIVQFR